jgi:hypothetical protein
MRGTSRVTPIFFMYFEMKTAWTLRCGMRRARAGVTPLVDFLFQVDLPAAVPLLPSISENFGTSCWQTKSRRHPRLITKTVTSLEQSV